MNVIARVESPYTEKFAIPRQPGIVSSAKGKVHFCNEYNNAELVRDLTQFTHIWIVFVFHQTQAQGWKSLVRPPRLGGNKKTGVLATRSNFRPNPIGMSVVQLDGVTIEKNGDVVLEVSGLDILDGTPVVDVKPYIPYCDALHNANAGFAQESPLANLSVIYAPSIEQRLTEIDKLHTGFSDLVSQVLSQDPRPAYKKNKLDTKVYGISLYTFNIQWQLIDNNTIKIIAVS
jgi:tRNA-Thr(GGU) m(6)t(6)A37 methyltransferase TsaA